MGIIQLLLEKGADPNGADDDGDISLISCSVFQQVEVTQLLLKHGAQVDVANNDGKKAIHAAATECDPRMIRLLLEAGADPNITTKPKFWPLRRAVLTSNMELLNLLLSHGADVNLSDSKGRNIVHFACAQSDANILKRVVEASPDALPQQRDDNGGTPLHVAVQNDNEEITLALMELGGASKRQRAE
ncbi:hypothetical protein QC764_504180 [Podospora pseudoanserina]|uniref:Ankyrin repeat protein n=1 Tax=Podospora pseudoanserina TaxID=2609844 RepID=A0ABR0I5J5_9PEZI|nr:hypothetical protein QC764_504180 [Podospora pseudoanserina]